MKNFHIFILDFYLGTSWLISNVGDGKVIVAINVAMQGNRQKAILPYVEFAN